LDYLYLAGGLLLLVAGGNLLVNGAIGLARRLGVSPLLIGLVIVGFGTSTPELVASLTAALQGAPAIAVGSVVGSNIANVYLIVGIGALLTPIVCNARSLRRDGSVLIASSIAFAAVVLGGDPPGLLIGLAFLTALAAYVFASYAGERGDARNRRAQRQAAEELISAATLQPEPDHRPAQPLPLAAISLLAGLGGVLLGADLLVGSAVALARSLSLSEAVVGVTVVAVGTSLPELATTMIAASRGHSEVALGNVIGSNIFNVLGVLGASATVAPLPIPPEIAHLDLWVMLAGSALLIVFAATGRRIGRGEGVILLSGYVAYYVALLA
jgi:cation:H+ antiporter